MITSRIKKGLLVASLVLMGSTSLHADAKGAYVGLGYGMTTYSDGGFLSDLEDYRDRVGSSTTFSDNYSSNGFKLYGGYQFNKIIAIEASYTKYGNFSLDYSNGNDIVLNPTTFAVAANIGSNFGDNNEFRAFALVGVGLTSFNENGSVDAYDSNSAGSFKYGIGFEYSPLSFNGFGFRAAFEGDYYITKVDSAEPEFDDTYAQGNTMFYIGAQYKF